MVGQHDDPKHLIAMRNEKGAARIPVIESTIYDDVLHFSSIRAVYSIARDVAHTQ